MPKIGFGGLAHLGGDERGTSIMELALVAPILAMMVVGVADLAMGFSARFSLQQAANRTLEMGHLGSVKDGFGHLVGEAAAAAGVNEDQVQLDTWLECGSGSSKQKKAFGEECNASEAYARYIRLTINSTYSPAFKSFGFWKVSANGTVPISANAALRVQ